MNPTAFRHVITRLMRTQRADEAKSADELFGLKNEAARRIGRS